MEITLEKLMRHLIRRIKKIKPVIIVNNPQPRIIFVLGYGRSGTSILINLLQHDFRIDSHGELSKRIMNNYLLDSRGFMSLIRTTKYKYIALKPILNSYEADYLLNFYNNSQIVWLVRDYRDVVYSGVKKFGNVVSDYLKNYIIDGKGNNWITKLLPSSEYAIIKNMETANFTDYDWMAMVWWSVNHIIISQQLYDDKRILFIDYHNMVNSPKDTFCQLFDFMGLKETYLHKYIKSGREGKGKNIVLNKNVALKCDHLYLEFKKFSSLVRA